MDNLYILVVDDSQQIRDFVIEYILKPEGFKTAIAVDGAEGLEKALTTSPDLILLDFEMPKMTGIEVLRQLRAQGNRTPVILMTYHGSEQLAVEFFRLGVQDYMIKPFKPEEMLDAIENALAITHLRQEKDALMHRLAQANRQKEQVIGELNLLAQVSKTITRLTQPQKVLNWIAESALFITNGDKCTLTLIDPTTKKIKETVQKQKTTKTSDANQETVSVPLEIAGHCIGSLAVSRSTTEKFTPHDSELLTMLADYAAIGIYNLRLMYQLGKQKDKEKQQIRSMFEKYVAPTVVEQLLTQPDRVQLGGTRQKVAVIFADIRGFSGFSNKVSPEILITLLNQYMQVAADAILAKQGTLDKFMGDAIMAFFNAPLPQQDYPLRVVQAAWALQHAVAKVHAYLPKHYQLHFGIGIEVGDVVVGNIGTTQLMNFTILGDAVNKAKRLQEIANGGQILISDNTYQLIKKYIQVKKLGEIKLKGQEHTEIIYEVVRVAQSKK